jgi:hypothetical protein
MNPHTHTHNTPNTIAITRIIVMLFEEEGERGNVRKSDRLDKPTELLSIFFPPLPW